MRTRFKIAAAVAVATALALTGCSSSGSGGGDGAGAGASDEPFKVIAFTSGNQTPVGAWWVKAVTAQAEELGWDLTMIQGDFDFQKMNPAVESAIGQGADVILDGYTDVSSIGSIVTAAKDAEIPIFSMDAGTEATDAFATNITTNQQQIVDKTVEAIDESIGGLEGKTVMVIGHDPHAGIRLRSALAVEAFEDAGATVVSGEPQQVTNPATGRTEALNFVSDYLSANPDGLDAVWAGWDDAALGAAQALSEAGSTAPVTGVDALAETLASIEAGGNMLATIEQPWPAVLDMLIEDVQAYQEDGELPAENFVAVDVTLVTKENAADTTPSDQLG
ncbi:sugar ABC transporter substrate-binding protein [Microbacterium sp. zg.B48]|uniref:sugar ABC transporter substrate-binding protein n=1 Tax=unclassified Microbacterium TaxID=2609290 RepID=UPI00214BDB48|nr:MULTISPECIES: sugar ABC transporter substrate-binding protein [unclassified Microbacterium]MCR2762894.1 sugar ABC transporter substrate-binding protein [Microbacterium sp. zg.B48]MCR2808481.1 sugar ABC transporter substrate-binding protein [Microbacterium sp. zg.B185]WIM19079.1 sugar ABC transporter substrate-binding protein [Microbacterium sp. zg-B185]